MMVPQMQGKLIDAVLAVSPEVQTLYDPFAGSGTILTETMLRGRNFQGLDINPLAILLCHVKAVVIAENVLLEASERILKHVDRSNVQTVELNFPGLIKWFRSDIALELSKLREAIRQEEDLEIRRFFWVGEF